MAASVLRFNGQQVGTVFKRYRPASHLITPPARRVGLFQPLGDVNSDSRNLLYAFVFHVAIKAADNRAAVQAIHAIQSLAGQRGDITVIAGFTQTLLLSQYTIDEVSVPELADGYGGRFAEDATITVVGNVPPQF